MTLRRGAGEPVALVGYLRRYGPDALVGALRQGDASVEIMAAPLTAAGFEAPPREPDELRTQGNSWTVLFAAPIYEGADLIGYTLTVRGG